MISSVIEDEKVLMISAEDQAWDKDTLKELREKHNIIFMTSGDGIRAFKILEQDEYIFGHHITSPLVAVGHEDDGTICFKKGYMQFQDQFDSAWIDSIIADLKEVNKICNKLRKE